MRGLTTNGSRRSGRTRSYVLLGLCAISLGSCGGGGKIDANIFNDAKDCFARCYRPPDNMDEQAEFFATPYEKNIPFRKAYDALIAKLPSEFAPLTRRLKDDPRDLPMGGDLRAKIRASDSRTIHVYADTGYPETQWPSDKRRFPRAKFWIAYDPVSRQMGGILNWGEKWENYQFVGDREPIVSALAYIAATEAQVQEDFKNGAELSHADPALPLGPESLARAEARADHLASHFLNGKITGADWPVERGEALRKPKRQWWVVNSEFTSCHLSGGPADKLDEFAGFTDRPTTRDFRGASGELAKVEVSADRGDGYDSVWTYFRSEQQCLAEQVNYSRNLADKYR